MANQSAKSTAMQHRIEEKKTRGRCSSCYKKYSEKEGRQSAMKNAKKVYSFCPACSLNVSYMCVSCFFERHTCLINYL